MAQKVQFVETVLRDANQSLIATRLPYDKFAPMLETIDKTGYYAVECWGGATFDVCLRYLNEDPWERLRKIRAAVPNTKLQMLLRGQNVLGYSHYPDDFVKLFVQKSVENGIDIIRIFDALNDTNNLKVAMEATVKAGAIASGTLSYTTSPVHTQKKYVEMVKELKEMGASTICIKDMAGIMGPKEAYDLVSAIKDAAPELPIDLHTHSTTGLAFMTYLKAVEAGVDIIDTAISPFSGGTSQPATETLAYALRQLGYEVDLDDKCTKKMADYFKVVRDDYIKDGTLMPKSMATDTQCLTYQIPGGMLSNLLSQLKQVNALDRFDEVLVETPKVRKDMGYPPLVTPTSQMVGVQAVRNVLDGQRYKSVSKEIKAYCRGEYGHTPAPIDPEIQKMILGDEKPLTVRYADTLEPVVDKTREKLGDLARSDEDVLSYIAFPNLAEKFFEERKAKEENVATYSIVECQGGTVMVLSSTLTDIGFVDAAVVALLGYAVVFFGLVLLMIVVIGMGKIFIAKEKKVAAHSDAAKAAIAAVPEAPAADAPAAPGTAGKLKLYDVEPKTAAMLMAIVADKMGKPLNELRFISIKEVK